MPSPNWNRVREIFENCLAQTTDKRESYLRRECGENEDLLKEVQRLLGGDEAAQSEFLEWPRELSAQTLPSDEERSGGDDEHDEFPPTRSAVPVSVGDSRQIGRYKLLKEIGEGGMGKVWLAQQSDPVNRKVAIKLIKSRLIGRSEIARFEAERQALALMDHPNIAKIFDAGTTDDGLPFYVMEYINGIPLTKYCDKHRLSVRDRLQVFIPICRAIQHAHQKGVIHRDLKPPNILVAETDGFPTPKIIDFGLAKAIDHHRVLTDKTLFTEMGKVVGTLQYMSPEQAALNSNDIDSRTDIYSLGIVLYELLTGMTPLDRRTIKDQAILKVLEIIQNSDTPRPSYRLSSSGETITTVSSQRQIDPKKLQSILQGELDWVVMKSLEKDRNRRYETAASLADDIHRFLINEPVRARPPSSVYKIGKFVARNRLLVGTSVAVLVLLIGSLIASLIAWGQAGRATRLAKENEQEALEFAASMDELTTDVASRLLGQTIQFDYLPDRKSPLVHAKNSRAMLETSFGLYLRRNGFSREEQRDWFETGVKSFEELERTGELQFRSLLNYSTALDNVASQAQRAGEKEAAVKYHQKRIELWSDLQSDERIGQDKSKQELARSYLHLGLIRDSVQNSSKAIDLLLQIEAPTQQTDRLLADSFNNRAQDQPNKQDAETDMLRAIELLEKLGDSGELLQAYENLALIENELGKTELERSYRGKALELALKTGNANFDEARKAAISHFNAGLNLHRKEKLEQALEQYTLATSLLRPLVDGHPEVLRESVYAQSFWHRAQALLELGRHEEAIPDWNVAIETGPTSEFGRLVPYFEAQLLRCKAGTDPVAAASTLDPLLWDIENKADVLMIHASIYSLAAQTSAEEIESAKWIEKAIAAVKWVKDSGRLQEFMDELKTSDEFSVLREREEFASLIEND